MKCRRPLVYSDINILCQLSEVRTNAGIIQCVFWKEPNAMMSCLNSGNTCCWVKLTNLTRSTPMREEILHHQRQPIIWPSHPSHMPDNSVLSSGETQINRDILVFVTIWRVITAISTHLLFWLPTVVYHEWHGSLSTVNYNWVQLWEALWWKVGHRMDARKLVSLTFQLSCVYLPGFVTA